MCFIALHSSYDVCLLHFHTHFYFIISSSYLSNEYNYNIILIGKKNNTTIMIKKKKYNNKIIYMLVFDTRSKIYVLCCDQSMVYN